ncbi:hypothetical protein FHR84_002207 [Actinopolyspora biskrensis]|uniref:Uncharacterized protein n=1 Tax=Actinopolyspora biskrensis TaxID=1470178 RepID=A0A852YYS8_9ACTN|nr:hypothetical protein [Actinopolyspora biskrensis]NYH78882.1 hypothetical protein [Actinopolyspora biskrensis]
MTQQLPIGSPLPSAVVRERLLRSGAVPIRGSRGVRPYSWFGWDNVVCALLVVGMITAGLVMFQVVNSIGP